MKGIVLAGGSGTRLHPITKVVSKQLLPIFDKPMVYYPVSTLMLAGIKEILIISTPTDLPLFKRLLGTGEELGVCFEYVEQPSPDGLAQAFILGEEFIGEDDVCLVLGDNVFYGSGFSKLLEDATQYVKKKKHATIFSYQVQNPEQYGVVSFDKNYQAVCIQEKPTNPKSSHAVVGLYFYPNSVIEIAKQVKPSKRGELEITSVNQYYLKAKQLSVQPLNRGFTWLDTGTHASLLDAGKFIATIEERQGLKVACLEEIAYLKGFINKHDLFTLAQTKKEDYKQYLLNIVNTSLF